MDKLKTSRLDKKEGKMQRSRAGVVVFRGKQGGQGNGKKETSQEVGPEGQVREWKSASSQSDMAASGGL